MVDVTGFANDFTKTIGKIGFGKAILPYVETAELVAKAIDFSADWLADSDAFYKLHVSGIVVDEAEIVMDHRIKKDLTCGANTVNFKAEVS
jgi:hypothetical protein